MIGIRSTSLFLLRARFHLFDLKQYSSDKNNDSFKNMSTKLYWEKFYKKHNKTPFEWIIDSSSINEILHEIDSFSMHKPTYILDAGSGSSMFSSKLSEKLSKSNYLLCADFSDQALNIIQITNQNKRITNIDLIQCDCKKLPIRDNIFNIILDKGYIDSLLKKMFISTSKDAMSESLIAMSNLLEKLEFVKNKNESRQSNYLIQITDETPELRISLLDQIDASHRIEYFFKEISGDEDENIYYAYFIRKV